MRRAFLLIAALAVAAASCSSGTDTAAPAVEASPTSTVAQSEPGVSTMATTVPDSAPSETVPDSEAPPETAAPVDGTPAPDFTMTLNDGSTFTLSEEQKPVYLVFWAEW
jgi:hypothetical protein